MGGVIGGIHGWGVNRGLMRGGISRVMRWAISRVAGVRVENRLNSGNLQSGIDRVIA